MVEVHSILRWVVIGAALVAFVALVGRRRVGRWEKPPGVAESLYAYLLGLQALVGLWLWLTGTRWTGEDPFLSWIHPAAMIAATAVAHIGLARTKKAAAARRRSTVLLGTYLLSLVIVLLAIPTASWPV